MELYGGEFQPRHRCLISNTNPAATPILEESQLIAWSALQAYRGWILSSCHSSTLMLMHCPWGNGLAVRNNHPHYFFIHWISAIPEAKHLLWGPSWWASNFQALTYDLPWKGLTLSRTLMVYLRENRWSGGKQESIQVPLAICRGAGLPDQRTWDSNIPARVHGERRMLETLAAENIICVIKPTNYDKIRKDTSKGKAILLYFSIHWLRFSEIH